MQDLSAGTQDLRLIQINLVYWIRFPIRTPSQTNTIPFVTGKYTGGGGYKHRFQKSLVDEEGGVRTAISYP